MKFYVIVNPAAGRGDVHKSIPQLHQLLRRAGLDYQLVQTDFPGQATQLARQAGHSFDTVVGVGGDGIMNEIINGVVDTPAAIGLVPAGTGNDLARTLGIPLDIEKSIAVLQRGKLAPLDLGKDIDGYFAGILGLGFPSDVMIHANTSTSFLRGSTAITASIVQVVNKMSPYRVTIQMDNHELATTIMGLFILNTRFTGGGVQVAPRARHDDGMLDVVIMREMGKLEFLNLLPKAYKGKHLAHPQVDYYLTRKIKVTTALPMRKDFDGNVYGQSPVDAEVIPGAVKVWVPQT